MTQAAAASHSLPPPTLRRHQDTAASPTPTPWTRPLKQFGLFFIGAGFLAASVAVTRRSVIRRQRQAFPKFYSPNGPAPEVDSSEGSLLGVQALGLATLNVSSFAVMLTGGLSWAFDVSSVEELREKTQAALRRPGRGGVTPEDEKEFEQMMNNLLEKLGMDKLEGAKPGGEEVTKKEG